MTALERVEAGSRKGAANPSAQLATPWRTMLVVNACLMAALFYYKVRYSSPALQYTQLLADYHFGFMKRALIGALVGVAFPSLPTWATYAVGAIAWLATLVLFTLVFDRVFSLRRQLPLYTLMIASPLFLKNFIQTLGFYDIYGCVVVLAFLLIPARSVLYVIGAAVGAALLLTIHHVHMLLYIPTLIAVVALRLHLLQPLRAAGAVVAAAALLLLAAYFLFLQFKGSPPVPVEQLEAYMNSRMTGPPLRGDIWPGIYYRTVHDELHDTWAFMPTNAARFPVYALLIALHFPLIRLFRTIVRSLPDRRDRHVVVAAVIAVSVGYLLIFATVFDYSRWVASWGVCMMLLLHATAQLAAARGAEPAMLDERRARWSGWVLTALPRLGTVTPF